MEIVYLKSFTKVFLIFLFGYYLIPVGISYFVFFIWKKNKWKTKRIQNKFPESDSIKREIIWSLISVTLFSVLTVFLLEFIENDYTQMYFKISDYGVFYLIVSPLIAIILHDTYYYWMHRAMHHRKIFKYTHRIHHQSITPTPWAIYAFQPLEAIFTYFSFAFAVFVIPMHPISLCVYLLISLINNIGGHTGFEILPRWVVFHKIARYSNVVTFHDQHHTDFNCNYSAYFNIWDRLMKTMHPDFEITFNRVKDQEAEDH